VTHFADYEQVMLTQQVIHIIDTTCLRVFYWDESVVNFACGDSAENIGETAIGSGIRLGLPFPAKVYSYSLISKGPTLTLKGDRECAI
jgi:hypothetical protein